MGNKFCKRAKDEDDFRSKTMPKASQPMRPKVEIDKVYSTFNESKLDSVSSTLSANTNSNSKAENETKNLNQD